jgi:hypothetical protein
MRLTVRTRADGERVLKLLDSFLAERGLTLSEEKTQIRTVDEGFDFLSHFFIKKDGYIHVYPTDQAVERFIADLTETIQSFRKSQRDLIGLLNQKLRGWANYYRYSDAADAFRRVDTAVQAALLESAMAKHPRLAKAKIISKYWYGDGGEYMGIGILSHVLASFVFLYHTSIPLYPSTHQKRKSKTWPCQTAAFPCVGP